MVAEPNNRLWIVDTGATDHITNNKDWFVSFECFKTPFEINIGDQSKMVALGKGTIKFEAAVDGQWIKSHMNNVLYAPSARRNLLSVITALDNGLKFQSSKSECEFVKDGVVKSRDMRISWLFEMAIRVIPPEMSQVHEANLSSKDLLQIWHKRLGHQNKRHD